MDKISITFARQIGSGGGEVAQKVSQLLGLPYYDKQKIVDLAKESGISENLFDGLEEHPTSSLLYSLVIGLQKGKKMYSAYDTSFDSDNVFGVQSKVIRRLAEEKGCVFVGRCSDYILREYKNVVNVFIHAGLEFRAQRVMADNDMKENSAIDYINKIDKRRKAFYNFYTNRIWGETENYDLTLNTEKVGIDKAAELIVSYVNML